ncbi:MAG: TraR/DksA family transcriptional regulator [Bacteriovoracaceae bacterium]|nr:TraR/DksA family transcriptional regulator [Bacteriovoracaceae bacterium]
MAPVKNKPLTKKQLDQLKEKLLEERQTLIQSASVNAEELGLTTNVDVSDEVDAAVADYEGSQMLRFKNRELFYIKKIEKALKKIDANEYGECTECDGMIKFERLLARPTADLCIQCKEEAEREESSNIYGRMSKSMGKTIDLSSGAAAR